MSKSRCFKKSAALSSSACLLLAMGSPSVIAQQVNAALNSTSQEQSDIEVIEVTGVRGALENALNTKREATSIVDAISSTDIDALPALDFGEALQALPGVQLDRSNEGRTSEISLRGLSGGFVQTTAFGQSFATPSRSYDPTGGTNPFAAFEAGVFDGVTLIKSPTADMQAGGIAGIVDKQLQQALAKKDGQYNVSLGGRYEDLTGNWDKTLKFSASKHLIQDELAVAFKFSGSDQTFRRDLVQFTQYTELDSAFSNTVDAYKAEYNLPADAKVSAVSLGRNVSEYSAGDRVSFTGNVEWKPMNDLKLGAHVLYTERDLDEGTKEDTAFSAGMDPTRVDRNQWSSKIEPDMATAPFAYKDGEYIVSKAHFTDGAWQPTNRVTTFLETSKGIMFYADYSKNDWNIDGVVSYSESENEFMNLGLDLRHNEDYRKENWFKAADAASRAKLPAVATGIDGTISTGQGDLASILINASGWDNYNYDNLNWSEPSASSSSVLSLDPSNNGRRVQMTVDGRVDNPIREMSSLEFNAERILQIDLLDELNIGSVKFGARASTEALTNRDQKIGAPGINFRNIDSTFLHSGIISERDTPFFDGTIPGTFTSTGGWLTFNTDYVTGRLQDGLLDLSDTLTIAQPSGFYDRLNSGTGLPQLFANNFSVDQDIKAVYAMVDFSGELGSIYYRGNFGVRHERTENDFLGFVGKTEKNGNAVVGASVETVNIQTAYSNTLPSLNLSFEVSDEFIIRTSYYQSVVRPNLRVQTPTLAINETASKISIELPKAEVEPYTANNIDLSFEWYNRDGSAISLGLFQKDISGLFGEQYPCPRLGEYPQVDAIYGEFTGTVSNGANANCTEVNEFVNPDTSEVSHREVSVERLVNLEGELTLRGVELAAQQKLDFLPYPWNGFGGVFNYTYINQDGETADDSKLYKVSPRSANLIGYWEDDNFSIRLAYNWRDSFEIKFPGGSYYGTENRFTKASGRLDLSTSYKIAKGLKAHLKAYNLSNENVYEYFGNDERAVARIDYSGRIYELSVNYSF